jgi:hypothetical protein
MQPIITPVNPVKEIITDTNLQHPSFSDFLQQKQGQQQQPQ